MYALVVSPERTDQVRQAIQGDIVYESDETLDSESTRIVFEAVARVSARVLIVDMAVGPGRALIAGIRHYRIARPQTRIILLAPGREPGDQTVAQLVGLGVYDIIPGANDADWTELVRTTLQKPAATFAQAARWHVAHSLNGDFTVRERVSIERVPLGTLTIAVAGVAPGVGCTHTALLISNYLSQLGRRVGLTEIAPRPALASLSHFLAKERGGYWQLGRLDIYPDVDLNTDLSVTFTDKLSRRFRALGQSGKKYEYLVFDLGPLSPAGLANENHGFYRAVWQELLRSSLPVIVGSGAPWRYADWGFLLHSLRERQDAALVIAAPTGDQAGEFSEQTGLSVVSLPFSDPFSLTSDVKTGLAKLVNPVVPIPKVQKPSLFKRVSQLIGHG